jgi:2-polyprenyl-3-methyl-5-hydroxy-6-metoxy-1,4-benzoquinol methylase
MWIDTTHRSNAPEMMDDFSMKGDILKDALDKIANINQLLGGNKITIEGVKSLLKGKQIETPIRILDIGCGNGDMLRALAQYAVKHKLNFSLTGIDANAFTIQHAKQLSINYPNIHFECKDIFDNLKEEYDIMLCTLTLHHFKDEEITNLLSNILPAIKVGIVINDLQRSRLAYYLFKALCFAFKLNYMSREDGLTSILRGFKKVDLWNYASLLKLKSFSIKWKWAFRYQWIIRS